MEIKTYYQIEYTDNSNATIVLKELANSWDFDTILDILKRLSIKGKLSLTLYGYLMDEFSVVFEGTDKLLYEARTEVI